jgi:hypothetical protein
MRNVVLVSALAFAALLPACLCGAYSGGGDTVYQRNTSDTLILCENGGFVANLASGPIEGHYMKNPAGSTAAGFGVRGEDGQLAFDLYATASGATTPELGDAPWTKVNLDKTALDHADIQCQDLVNRTWWTAP